MGNNRSSTANIFHGNTPPASIRKFWKKKSSKSEQHSLLKMENAILAQTMRGQTRRSSLNQQAAAKKQAAIFGSLRKSKSEKVKEVFGSSDLPLLNNENNDCAESIDMENSSGKQLTPVDHEINRHFVRSTVLNTGRMDRPPAFCSSASTSARFIHHHQEKTSSDSNRRSVKSFRHFPSTRHGMTSIGNRAIISGGPISGLSHIQKRLILNRWRNFDRKNLFEICSVVFERFFQNQPQFASLHFCNQENEQNGGIAPFEILWKTDLRKQRSFQIHVERFSTVLFFALDGLEEENSTLDQLPMEYGASYAASNNNNSFPSQYWEFFRQCLIDQNSSEKTLMSLQHNPFIDSLDRPFSRIGSRRSFEAWIAFATFLVSKIRFGYEMERFLQKRFYRMTWNSEKEINGTLPTQNCS